VVFWTHTIAHRRTGWLDSAFHAAFREIMLHAAVREDLLCPIYTLMPDHLHLIWMGVSATSDQRRATAFLRKQLEMHLASARWQHQPHDHVLRDEERKRGAFAATCAYVAENPVRAGLATKTTEWPFTGCVVPGYPKLHPFLEDFWEKFWRMQTAALSRGHLGKRDAAAPP
jgi:REP element-mobilizing transposase RayT